MPKPSLLLRGLSGKLGNRIIKQYDYGTVITKVPDMSKIKPSVAQKKKRNRFSEAVAYAKSILADPEKKAAYKKKVKRGKTVYHTAIAEYLKKHPTE